MYKNKEKQREANRKSMQKLREKQGITAYIRKWIYLAKLFKTPFITLRANTWRITKLKVKRYYSAESLHTGRIGKPNHVKQNAKLQK